MGGGGSNVEALAAHKKDLASAYQFAGTAAQPSLAAASGFPDANLKRLSELSKPYDGRRQPKDGDIYIYRKVAAYSAATPSTQTNQ